MTRKNIPMSNEQIEREVARTRERLQRLSSMPPPAEVTPAQAAAARTERLVSQLGKAEVLLERSDQRRLALLLRTAKLHHLRGDYAAVYGVAAEVLSLCRTRVLGVQGAHPVLTSMPPVMSLGSGEDTTH